LPIVEAREVSKRFLLRHNPSGSLKVHFLGLFHTTEKDGSNHDPLGDTPECSSGDDANSNGTLEPSECPDGGNLMFWGQSDTADLSDDQSWVLRRNPDVY